MVELTLYDHESFPWIYSEFSCLFSRYKISFHLESDHVNSPCCETVLIYYKTFMLILEVYLMWNRPLRLPAILVGDGHLGGISGTIAAYECLTLRGYDVVAIILEDHGLSNEVALQSYLRSRYVLRHICLCSVLHMIVGVEILVS